MDNQRRSFRLDVEVGFEVELISEEELQEGITRLKMHPDWSTALLNGLNEVDNALQAVLDDLRKTAPKAAGAIELVNRKIDLLRAGDALGEKVQDLPLQQVNLSATGLAFEYQSAMDVGVPARCMLTLPNLGWTMELYARVVSVRLVDGGLHKVCLDYEFIRAEDSEQLIRFNLLQQQMLLGEKLNGS